jgi:hypothetical protein
VQSPEFKLQTHKKQQQKRASDINQVWWYKPTILALGRLRQEDFKLHANLDYRRNTVSKKDQDCRHDSSDRLPALKA